MKNLNHSELRSFFYGTLLGDSYIYKNSFCCKQITKQLLEYKAKIISQHLPDAKVSISSFKGYTDKNGVNHQDYYQLNASGAEYFKKLNKIFYPDGKKVYPSGTVSKLTPIGFAMWYADDGTTVLVGKNDTTGSARSRRIQICSDGFAPKENLEIQKELIEKGYDTKIINRNRKNQFRVQIATKVGQLFLIEIEPFFHNFPELLYKMDMGYRNFTLDSNYVYPEYKELFLRVSSHPQFKDRMIGR